MRARIICPVFNEVEHIDRLVEQFASKGTLVLIDGGSTDGSVEKLERYAREERIIYLTNPDRYVSFALNRAIERVDEDIVVRIDAHTDYAEDYVDAIIRSFERSGADIVGGPTGVRAEEDFQKAVAQAICTPFGMGGGKVHDLRYEGDTDAVTFGAWRREVLEQVGPWDTELIRNQDDEHHYRAFRMGMRIYQDPSIRLWYHPRRTVKGLFLQYYQYGLYKPLVWEKVDRGVRLRHLIPSLFVLYLVLLPLFQLLPWGGSVPLYLYLILLVFYSLKTPGGVRARLWSLAVYPVMHLGYGLGVWMHYLAGRTRNAP